MLDTLTKKRIDDCRDILVGKLPDPKAQIEQITIGLIYKFMDDMDKEAIELGGKAKFFSGDFEKYSWDNLFDSKVTAHEMLGLYSEAIVSMDKNPNIPQLFRDIFKNAYLPYRDPETLKMFLKTISEFEYTHSEKLGDAFEYLLSVMGSQGDAGQFRTPRHIIDFLVAAVNPGKTDTILDPACGTAGFLISAFKHIIGGDGKPDADSDGRRDAMHRVSTNTNTHDKTTITPDERKRIIGNITGYDISPDMVRLSLVNLYLHGFSDPHIWEYDTLSSEDRWKENYDVILANPPFMSPKGGIRPHKKFSISSNRSEVLFVDYIAEHLNPNGRAGIIVPEGIIFQSGTAYKDLRKMLIDNYLYAVVSLPAGVFNPYSGVKTSILLMDKQIAKITDEILFVKVANDGFGLGAQRNAVKGGQLDDAIKIIRNFVTTIKNNESPTTDIVETQCIASLPTTQPSPPTTQPTPPTTQSLPQTTLPDIAYNVPKSEIAKNGDYNLSDAMATNAISTDGISIDAPPVETRCIASLQSQSQPSSPTIQYPDIAHTVPKSEIAKNGDYNLSGERYKITAHHQESDFPLFKLSEITEIKKGTSITKESVSVGSIPVIAGGQQPAYYHNIPNREGKTITVSSSGAYAGFINYFERPIFASDCTTIQSDESIISTRFLFQILKYKQNEFYKLQKGGAQPHVYGKDFGEIQIPLPPLSIQQEIVAEIEGYQKIIDGAKMVVENYKPKIDIDEGWEMVELGDIIKTQTGGTPSKSNIDFWIGDVPWVSPKDMKMDFIGDSEDHINKNAIDNSSTKMVPENTVLIVVRSGILQHSLPVALTVKPVSFNQDIIAINTNEKILTPKYLFYYLKSTSKTHIKEGIKPGVTVQSFHNGYFKKLIFPLPPLEIQN